MRLTLAVVAVAIAAAMCERVLADSPEASAHPATPAQPAATPQAEPSTEPEHGDSGDQGQNLAAQLTNPIADLASIPFQFNWNSGVGPSHELQLVLNIQPVVPIHLTKDWNLVGRYIVPLVAQPSAGPGLAPTFGIGDIVFSLFVSPNSQSKLVWGFGPVFGLPGGTDPAIGSGQWLLGPTGIGLYLDPPWTVGALVNQLWSIASTGDTTRSKVSQMFAQPFIAYTRGTWTLTAMSEMTFNWETTDGKASIPLELFASKLTKIGFLPLSVQVGGGWFVDSPAGGPDWRLRLSFVVLLPDAKQIKARLEKK
jgi:hypothetical protein